MNHSSEHNIKWLKHIIAYCILLVSLFFFYYEILSSLVDIWMRSEAYGHGSLVIIISFLLIWWKRKELYPISPRFEILAIPFILLVVLLGVLARQVDVIIIQQYVFISLIQLSFLLVFGKKIAGLVLFPLVYMYLAVPVGESLLQPMVGWTATFVIKSIELIGIPIYSEGNYFTLPSARWSVVEACSGTRYFFASLTLGTLYAYLTYSNYYKRAIFILISAVFPIVANWLRALSIVLIAHYNDMALAKGVDHFLYGWVFFGIVIFIMFWIGSFWADSKNEVKVVTEHIEPQVNNKQIVLLTLLSIVIISLGSSLDNYLNKITSPKVISEKITIPDTIEWKLSDKLSINWKPNYFNPSLEYQKEFIKDDKVVGVYIAYYASQKKGSELINSKNRMLYEKDPIWHQLKKTLFYVNLIGTTETVIETHLTSEQQDIVLFHWNNISGSVVTNDYQGKMLELLDKLTGNIKGEYAIVLYTVKTKTNKDNSKQLIQVFVNDMYLNITGALEKIVVTTD